MSQFAERDPDLDAGGQLVQASADPGQNPGVIQGPRGEAGLQLRIELEDMEVQAVLGAGAFADELLAVVVEQPDLHRWLVKEGDGEAGDAFADDGAGDRERIDGIGLAGLALAATARPGQRGRDPEDAFAGAEQCLFEAL